MVVPKLGKLLLLVEAVVEGAVPSLFTPFGWTTAAAAFTALGCIVCNGRSSGGRSSAGGVAVGVEIVGVLAGVLLFRSFGVDAMGARNVRPDNREEEGGVDIAGEELSLARAASARCVATAVGGLCGGVCAAAEGDDARRQALWHPQQCAAALLPD